MDNDYGTMNLVITCFMIYIHVHFNNVFISYYYIHFSIKIQVSFSFNQITLIKLSLWSGGYIHVTIIIFNYLYQLFTDPKNTRCMPNISNNINAPRQIIPLGTMVNCFYVHILGIILLCLWLHSVYLILCLSIAVMFLVCGDVSACISACRHTSLKLRRIVITRMSPSCSINNNNRVAKLSETLYHIYKKEQYRSSFYSKMIKYLKTQTLTYLIAHNPLNSYNYHPISLYIFMYTVVLY